MLALDFPIVEPVAPTPGWRLPTRLAFRFCFLYFGLYVVTTQMLGGLFVLPVGDVPELGRLPPVRPVVSWAATHVFRVTYPLVISGSGSGDKTFDWVHAFCLLVISAVATAIWSVLARRRGDHVRLHTWFHLFARFALGSTMVSYGAVKAIPLQMSAPSLLRLLEPFGHFSPMGVLWASIGASRPYEMFSGVAELAGGILLFFPRTATLGALICLADTIQIFTLNMTYDVPVKLFSFHLILLSLFLLAPEARRLANVLVLNRTAGPSTQPPLGRSRRTMRIAVAAQIIFGLYLVGMNFNNARRSWTQYGGGAPKSALYGIWNVEVMSIDGHTRSPLVIDYDRWRRVVFDRPTAMAFQRMDDTFAQYGAAIDAAGKTVTVTKPSDRSWTARFAFQQPAPDRLILDGEMDKHKVHMQLQLFDRNKFLLVSRGFHWVQEYPFNR
jgi:hypothetical protein